MISSFFVMQLTKRVSAIKILEFIKQRCVKKWYNMLKNESEGGINMKLFSIFSFLFIMIGLLLFGVNSFINQYSEPIIFIGITCLLLAIILSFIAVKQREEGNLKFISVISSFIVLFLITWFEPFQIVRIMTWFKNLG